MQKLFLISIFSLLFFNAVEAQTHIKGVVKNGAGERVPGATINIKGTTVYTAADSLGEFSIEAPKAIPFTLHVTAAGFHGLNTKYDKIPEEPVGIILVADELLDYIVVTSRRRSEVVQNIPISISVVGTLSTRAINSITFSSIVLFFIYYTLIPQHFSLTLFIIS